MYHVLTPWITDGEPEGYGFLWIKLKSGAIELACWTGSEYQYAYTVGDSEGLSIEYYNKDEIIGWCDLEEPVEGYVPITTISGD